MDVAFQEGIRYLTGDGDVDASEEAALKCFLSAAARGSIPALVNAGMLYERKEQYCRFHGKNDILEKKVQDWLVEEREPAKKDR